MKTGSLFSGYLGLDLAVREVFPEAETAFVADIDEGACKVLAYRAPEAPNLGDVSTVDWTPWARLIAILTAGFPCQDVSAAGKRAGLKAGTRTGLWHETARAIRELHPPLVLLENVRGLLSARGDEPTAAHCAAEATATAARHLTDWIDRRHALAVRQGRTDDARDLATRRLRAMGCRRRALDRARRHERRLVRAVGTVLGSLADLGYDAAWCGLRAADVGAPHGRWRVFILAWPADAESVTWSDSDGDGGAVADTQRCGRQGGSRRTRREQVGGAAAKGTGALLPTPAAYDGDRRGPQHPDKRKAGGHSVTLQDAVSCLLPTPTVQDGANTGGPSQFKRNTRPLNTEVLLLPTPAVNDIGAGKTPEDWDAWTERMKAEHGNGNGHGNSLSIEAMRLLPTPMVGDSASACNSTATRHKIPPTGVHAGDTLTDAIRQPDVWGKYASAIQRWEQVTRPAPAPTETGPKGNPRLSCHFDEWLMGLPAGWITDVPGVTHNEALKLCGNGVVPQQGAAALRWLLAVRESALQAVA
jgi:DNA (cytosine-5)-methyltransferase 1